MPFQSFLPLVPNVTIQYRCGDNVGFGKTRYGLLPFSVYSSKRIDPAIAKFIYVIADRYVKWPLFFLFIVRFTSHVLTLRLRSPSRQSYHAYASRCGQILQRLFEHLRRQFPSSIVVVKRGGDAFLDYARVAYSNIVICSASTFCLWPALSNTVGKQFVHIPTTIRMVLMFM